MLLKGIVIGFLIAAPVGPVGLLCIYRTLNEGRSSGIFSGLGAATADALYGCVAGFGLIFVSNFLVQNYSWLQLIGGVFLCFLGIMTFSHKVNYTKSNSNKKSLLNSYASTFIITLTNPLTILSYVAIFAGLGVVNPGSDYWAALLLVIGVFLGSLAWWIILSSGLDFFRFTINSKKLQWINRLAGILICLFGTVSLATL